MTQLTEYQKHKIIFMYENNNSITLIAAQLKINRNTVSKWINRYLYSNMDRIEGSGRPRKFNNDILISIQQEINNNKYITLNEIKKNIKKTNIDMSIYTIKKILNDNNYHYVYPPKRVPLSDDHKKTKIRN
jgi:transposase